VRNLGKWERLYVAAVVLLVAVVCVVALAGCSAKYWTGVSDPVTKLKLNPLKYQIELENSKDVDVEASDVDIVHDGTSLKIGDLRVTDTASGVRRANVAQIDAVGQAQLTQVAYLKQLGDNFDAALQRMDQMIGSIAPGGIRGAGEPQMDPFWYYALAAGVGLALLYIWRREKQ